MPSETHNRAAAALPAVCLLLAAVQLALAAAPSQSNLFTAGDADRKLYRIPGIVVTHRGTILAYAEGRRNTGGDWDTIDIVLRRSTDDGATFSPLRVIGQVPGTITRNPVAIERSQGKPTDVTYNNPVAIADRNGAVHFLFCVEYMRVFYMRSDDDGETFTTPLEITQALEPLRAVYPWRIVATGPGHGIQLKNGRLLVPIWLALGTRGNGHGPSSTSTIYSDDHGKTWHGGEIAIPDTPDVPSPNETAAVQLTDGRVMLNARVASPHNRRVVVTSRDGATQWTVPAFQENLPDPICAAGFLSMIPKRNSKSVLLFSNPDNLTRADGKNENGKDRKNVTIRVSYDQGVTWLVKRSIEPDRSGYSDLAALPNGTILCFYESAGKYLTLARFNLKWVTDEEDPTQEK
jgi:sialidase-1